MTSAPVMVYWVDEKASNQIYLEEPVPGYGQQECLTYPGSAWSSLS